MLCTLQLAAVGHTLLVHAQVFIGQTLASSNKGGLEQRPNALM